MVQTKVLVVDDDPNVQRILVSTLRQEGYEVVVAGDGIAGVEMAASAQPDVILMDALMPRLDGYAATQRIRAEERRHVPILMLTSEVDTDQRIRSLRAGADDFILKPFHPLELNARIKALLARVEQLPALHAGRPGARSEIGKFWVFYGAKGGVGTTTIAINTAIGLVTDLKRQAVLIDANLQFGDLRVFLDLGPEQKSIVDAMSVPDLDLELLRKILVHHPSGVDLLLAPPSPETADVVVERQRHQPAALTELINILRRSRDYVVADTAKTIDDFNLQLMDEADRIFVVMTADLSCVKNVRLVLQTMQSLGYEQDKVALVLNRSNAYTGINVRNIESALHRKIDYMIINEYRSAISALNTGEPVMWSRPESPLSASIRDFARENDELAHSTAREATPAPRFARQGARIGG